MPAQLYTGHEQGDDASLTYEGVTYRCFVYLDRARRSVESACFIVHENGLEEVLFKKTVRSLASEDLSVFGPDCPKIIATTSTFHVHWLEGEISEDVPINPALHKAWIDIANFPAVSAWTWEGSISLRRFMHDLQPIGNATDPDSFIATYTSVGDIPRVRRLNGTAWIDTDWDVALTHAVAHRILSVYADDDQDTVLVAYERTAGSANQVWCTRLDSSTGGAAAHAQAFTTIPACQAYQAGFARYSASLVSLVIEFAEIDTVVGSPAEVFYAIPSIAYAHISITTGASGSEHAWHHLRMLSRPFAFAGAREGSTFPNLYVLAAYKNALRELEFIQRNAFVLNLDAQRWADAADGTVRMRQCSNLNLGDIDARVSGYSPDGASQTGFSVGRRVNHLSNASVGAEVGVTLKTRTMAALAFAKIMSISSSDQPQLQPVHATIKAVRFHIEEPWVITRDPSEPAAPTQPYHGLNPYTVGHGFAIGSGGFFGGGTPTSFDGRRLVESGFAWYPEIYSTSDGGAGNIDAGARLYCVTYEHRDDKGQLHRSAPSIPVSHTVGNPPALAQATELSISTLTLTMRDNVDRHPSAQPVELVVWRTVAGGTVFHRVFAQYGASNRPQDTPVNDPTTWQVTALDNVSDADLETQEILTYQLISGAWTPLPPYQPPAFSCVAKYQNRAWGVSSQNGDLWYSNEVITEPGGTEPLASEFNPQLVHRVDGLGRCVALQEMDDALIMFLDAGIYAVTGFGADPSGAGSSLQTRTIITGVGCIDQRSVVLTTEGIFFQSAKGLYLLNRSQALEYITRGASVEDSVLAGGNVRGATHLEDRHEIRFALNDDVSGEPSVLVYDYQHDLWSHFTLPLGDQPGGSDAMSSVVGGCSWRGAGREDLHVIIEQGALLIEKSERDAAPYSDEDRLGVADDAVPLTVGTSWIHPSGLNGYQRCYEIQVSTEKTNASAVTVTVVTDFDGTYGTTYTETFPFASPAPNVLRCQLRYQKGAAFRVTVAESGTVPLTENLRITGASMKLGLKRGLRRG